MQADHLPTPGYSRLRDVLEIFPISRSAWYAAIEKGRVLPATKLGARTAVWANAYLNELLDRIESGEQVL